MAGIVYALCAVTALWCFLLLVRSYQKNRAKLLFWSALCFAMLTIDNLLLYVDLVVVPHIDLALWRGFSALLGVGFLLFGLIWKKKRQ